MGAILFTLVRTVWRQTKDYPKEYHVCGGISLTSVPLPLQFLAFDTQLLMGNKRYTISPEEYVFATLSLYLDIIYLFSFLLQIMGGGRD